MIYLSRIQAIMRFKGLRRADVARMAGVSRQAVSLWFRQEAGGQINLRASSLVSLCQGAKLRRIEDLSRPLPLIDDAAAAREASALFLWDHLYPDILDFAVALLKGELPAIARLVQEAGFFASEKLLGKSAWEMFPTFNKFIHPVRRKELEKLWDLWKRQAWN